jgi:hypothetical protein
MRVNSIIHFAAISAAVALALPALAATPSIETGSTTPPLELTAADESHCSLAAKDGPKVLIFYRGLW